MMPSDEHTDTIKLANHILNRVHADPDDDLAMLSRQFLRSIEARDRLAERVKELEKGQGQCAFCGGPMSRNPHPEAGKPERTLDVGCLAECIPCMVRSRHDWSRRALKEQRNNAALTQRLKGMELICRDFVKWASTVDSTTAHYKPDTTMLGDLISRAQQALEGKS